jgi:RNA polymerase sigma-70 factor (ECF subfamily)
MVPNEQNILRRIQEGSMEGLRELFDSYYAMLRGIAVGYLCDSREAEEVVSDVYCYIWENRDKLNIHTSIKAYLIAAVRNRCLNCLEQHKRERTLLSSIPVDACREDLFLGASSGTPLSDMITKELETAIEQAFNALPAACREVFRLSRFENLSYEEVAQQQNISINTVKTQMKIALQKLREALLR